MLELNFDPFPVIETERLVLRRTTLDDANDYFYSYGLDEIIELLNKKAILPKRVLIDVANGHMQNYMILLN